MLLIFLLCITIRIYFRLFYASQILMRSVLLKRNLYETKNFQPSIKDLRIKK